MRRRLVFLDLSTYGWEMPLYDYGSGWETLDWRRQIGALQGAGQGAQIMVLPGETASI